MPVTVKQNINLNNMISGYVIREKYNQHFCFFVVFLGFSRKGEVHSKGPGGCKGKLLLWIMWQAVSQTPGIW